MNRSRTSTICGYTNFEAIATTFKLEAQVYHGDYRRPVRASIFEFKKYQQSRTFVGRSDSSCSTEYTAEICSSVVFHFVSKGSDFRG